VTVFFVEPMQREPSRLSTGSFVFKFITLKRAVAVALVTVLACLLHCMALMWYVNRPAPLPVTEAKPLPMIDIALEAPSAGAPEEAKPLPPKPIPAKPKAKPIKKPKPKPITEKAKSEIKKPVVKEEQVESKPEPAASMVKDTAQNNPVVGTKTNSDSKRSESGKVTQARAFAGYLNNPKPNYPGIARSRHWEGLVMLRVYVTADGRCGNLNVARSSGHDVLDDSAVAAVRNWRFVPGKRGDTPIASWVTVPIQFHLRN
jgi:periplasmic protein TonB